ncbi:hypothetical protein TVAG_182010 [Trichomonas vaginalis G3]|uniref:Uncharacterized protein n=1 Tax=Trichomonas vaginalis (strain ATCC PRA-98 / G3) TaxID=412133 RepID=A2F6Y3_TRIV3|nr:protein ubiquitination [Trichomonas vaginalis G3]EAX99344.1 hypothetical protein TVAG_182010 [Trichomonas vaginalis G3]KAI5538968.1 protein ubiquitination [Trichomonas vaginalis G3]|eukprot:XP_001312274.1 hypothetical protein [Trichomonas vaginalis G3]
MNPDEISQIVAMNDVEALSKLELDSWTETKYQINTIEKTMQIPSAGLTLIHIAAFYDCLESFIFLEKKGLSFTTVSTNSFNTLYYICYGGSIEVFEYVFIKIGRDPSLQSLLKDIFEEDIFYIIKHTSLLDLAILAPCNQYEIATALFKFGYGFKKNGVDFRAEFALNPINSTIKLSNAKCLEYLIQFKKINQFGLSPLQIAIATNTQEAIPILIKQNGDLLYRNEHGETALSIACRLKNIYAVEQLCSSMKRLEEETHGIDGAAHWLCSSNSLEIAKHILQHPIDINRKNMLGQLCTGCFKPKKENAKEIVQILELLYRYGLELNDPTYPAIQPFITGMTILPEIVDWFLEKDIDIDIQITRHTGFFSIRDIIMSKKGILKNVIDKYHIQPSS